MSKRPTNHQPRPTTAVGFRAHTGWAAAVTITIAAGVLAVIDRRRVNLHDPAMPLEMYHVAGARSASAGEAKALIARSTRATDITARRALKDLRNELRSDGHDVTAAGVVLGSGRLVLPLASALRSHAASHAAEGELYRQSLVRAAGALGLRLTTIPEPILYEHASAILKLPPERIRALVADLGKPLGPPWTQDHKSAALVAWLALMSSRERQR